MRRICFAQKMTSKRAHQKKRVFRPSATVSRIGLIGVMYAWSLADPPTQIECDKAGSLMESCLCCHGGPPPLGGLPWPGITSRDGRLVALSLCADETYLLVDFRSKTTCWRSWKAMSTQRNKCTLTPHSPTTPCTTETHTFSLFSQQNDLLEVLESDEHTAKQMQPDMAMIEKYQSELRDVERKMNQQLAKLSGAGGSQTPLLRRAHRLQSGYQSGLSESWWRGGSCYHHCHHHHHRRREGTPPWGTNAQSSYPLPGQLANMAAPIHHPIWQPPLCSVLHPEANV